jgi:hypothetical protein
MKPYVFRDIYTGKLYRVRAYSPLEALRKVSRVKQIPMFNLARVQKPHVSR